MNLLRKVTFSNMCLLKAENYASTQRLKFSMSLTLRPLSHQGWLLGSEIQITTTMVCEMWHKMSHDLSNRFNFDISADDK